MGHDPVWTHTRLEVVCTKAEYALNANAHRTTHEATSPPERRSIEPTPEARAWARSPRKSALLDDEGACLRRSRAAAAVRLRTTRGGKRGKSARISREWLGGTRREEPHIGNREARGTYTRPSVWPAHTFNITAVSYHASTPRESGTNRDELASWRAGTARQDRPIRVTLERSRYSQRGTGWRTISSHIRPRPRPRRNIPTFVLADPSSSAR